MGGGQSSAVVLDAVVLDVVVLLSVGLLGVVLLWLSSRGFAQRAQLLQLLAGRLLQQRVGGPPRP